MRRKRCRHCEKLVPSDEILSGGFCQDCWEWAYEWERDSQVEDHAYGRGLWATPRKAKLETDKNVPMKEE